jgi:hypothetical protein
LEAEHQRIGAIAESGNTIRPTNEVFPSHKGLQAAYDEAKSEGKKLEAQILQDQIDISNRFTPKVVRDSIDKMDYKLKKPIASLDDFQKSLIIFAQQSVAPRANYIFDLITQLMVGEKTFRLMFETGKGPKNIVARKVAVEGQPGKYTYEVIREFEPDQAGQSKADALAKAMADDAPKDPSLVEGMDTSRVQTRPWEGASEEAARQNIGSIGSVVTITKDTLIAHTTKSPVPAKKTRAMDIHGTELIERSMNWLSTYYESAKVHALVEDLAIRAADPLNPMSSQEIQNHLSRLMRQILSGVDGSLELIKKHGPF